MQADERCYWNWSVIYAEKYMYISMHTHEACYESNLCLEKSSMHAWPCYLWYVLIKRGPACRHARDRCLKGKYTGVCMLVILLQLKACGKKNHRSTHVSNRATKPIYNLYVCTCSAYIVGWLHLIRAKKLTGLQEKELYLLYELKKRLLIERRPGRNSSRRTAWVGEAAALEYERRCGNIPPGCGLYRPLEDLNRLPDHVCSDSPGR